MTTGTHYTSITNFMQGYIDNEINLNDEHRCDGTCSDFKSTKNHECQHDTLCAHKNFARTRCAGDMFDCNTIDSDGMACLVVCSLECIYFFYASSSLSTTNDDTLASLYVNLIFFLHFFFTLSWFQHRSGMNGKIVVIIS